MIFIDFDLIVDQSVCGKFELICSLSTFWKTLDRVALTSDTADVDTSEAVPPDIVYYLSDGIFKSFSGIFYEGLAVKPSLISVSW